MANHCICVVQVWRLYRGKHETAIDSHGLAEHDSLGGEHAAMNSSNSHLTSQESGTRVCARAVTKGGDRYKWPCRARAVKQDWPSSLAACAFGAARGAGVREAADGTASRA
jgi:hypothetical protein